jgi:tRNA pseudouridine55 synthase
VLGFINLNKPAEWTSHDCVAKVRRLLRTKKVGHGGTLDPAATGVLPLAVGKATRLLQFLPENKAYRAKIRLGVRTNTDDLDGEIIETRSPHEITLEQIKAFLPQFIGKIEQIPPAFSAIRQDGKRLYELARKGEQVEVPTRIVEIAEIQIINWHSGEFAELELEIACGAGTYIRAIARDLGAMLGVGGTLASLIRTESCGMKLADSITLETLEKQQQKETFSLIPPAIALQNLSAISLSAEETKRWFQGQKISNLVEAKRFTSTENMLVVEREGNEFLGIGEVLFLDSNWLLSPKIVVENSPK